jgi:hypothetical protein
MQRKRLSIIIICLLIHAGLSAVCIAAAAPRAISPDLYLSGRDVVSPKPEAGQNVLVFEKGVLISLGQNRFSGDRGVVWVESEQAEVQGRAVIEYQVKAYLEGDLSLNKGHGVKDFGLERIAKGPAAIVWFTISGKVFVTADNRRQEEIKNMALYVKAAEAVSTAKVKLPPMGKARKTDGGEVRFRYPVNISPAGERPLDIDWRPEGNDLNVGTVMQRFYLSQKQQNGVLLELQADSAIIWRIRQGSHTAKPKEGAKESSDSTGDEYKAIYMSGDVVMTEGQRSIRADELYYDLEQHKGLAINAVIRSFDVRRGIPIYVRAAKLRRVAENQFTAENVTITSSEFYAPQLSFNTDSIIITDNTVLDAVEGEISNSSYDAKMKDVRFKVDDTTIFYWPYVRSNLERPDVPIKSASIGNDNDFGTSLETRWFLSRLLGLQEPEGTDGTFMLDYYSKRGLGAGAALKYEREDYFGQLKAYIIDDHGQDDLGRVADRRNLTPAEELRGCFSWQHRQYLPSDWQLTTEVSYLSDKNFLESFYRNEYLSEKKQETLVHLKRIEDNWGVSILGLGRINNFMDEMEELPSIEHHLTGQSLFGDRFTFYNDSQVSRFRQRLGTDIPGVSESYSTFASERAELDLPLRLGAVKLVPFTAGTVAFDDGSGFHTDIDGTTEEKEDSVLLGELGLRASTQYWKVYPNVRSRLWDIDNLRHVVMPHATAIAYAPSDPSIEQRDALNFGVSQRLQTKRGPADKQRTVEWMRLDMDVTLLSDTGDASAGPDRFLWNKPFIPMADTYSTQVPLQDRRSSDIFGPRRDYLGTDYIWRLSDTTAILSDMNYDLQSGVVQQLNVGFSHFRWPDLSYYIGSRYLRRVEVLDEKGSNVFTFAATYRLDPRYTVVFSEQFDFDYGAGIRSDLTLIRRYHRMYWSLTFGADQSLDRQSIMFSIWPQGIPEFAIGSRSYMKLEQMEED